MQGQMFRSIIKLILFILCIFNETKEKSSHICENKYSVEVVRSVNLTQLFKPVESIPTYTGSIQERFYMCCSYHRANAIIDTRFVILEVLSIDCTPKIF